ncbi:MAG: hypothetical protein ABI311_06495 [Gemmatimonadaceae bacterium]
MTTQHCTLVTVRRSALLTALLLASPIVATAHQASDTSGSIAGMLDMYSPTGVDQDLPKKAFSVLPAAAATSAPVETKQKNAVVESVSSMETVHGMSGSAPGTATDMSHQTMPAMSHESTSHMDTMAGSSMT